MEEKLESAVKDATAINSPNKPKSVFKQKNLRSQMPHLSYQSEGKYRSIECESGGGLILQDLIDYTSSSIMMDKTSDLFTNNFDKKSIMS